jgi:hypothetical protein
MRKFLGVLLSATIPCIRIAAQEQEDLEKHNLKYIFTHTYRPYIYVHQEECDCLKIPPLYFSYSPSGAIHWYTKILVEENGCLIEFPSKIHSEHCPCLNHHPTLTAEILP